MSDIKNVASTIQQQKTGILSLPYFKQGDDLKRCLIKTDDGKINVKESLLNHISLLKSSINILDKVIKILNDIPNANNEDNISINGDAHIIFLTGNSKIIEILEQDKLLEIVDNDDDVEEDKCISLEELIKRCNDLNVK